MKNIILSLIVVLGSTSCKEEHSNKLSFDASKVNEITIHNKVDCSFEKLVKQQLTITDKNQISKILDAFSYMEPIEDRGNVNMKVSNGFFELSFNEGNKENYFTINYTIYDGVVIWSNDGGKLFKNDRLEIVINDLFVK
ncbi:hypothetical protein H1R17_03145 [Flavobacterium sp. xlx-214]|uniref:hypothetical protein n=1 Tax=unclassified Flavobacterium TaxID=196869 RepID=UPI0013D5789D|nr:MULTISPECIES: hypothetical protein [unclassified Flavobacterium]MBA5793291.1 hypothetical protein [Flavobacterium sp. xlx-221]QMI84144.1 hypothetical protein H1R17_03145 [Flavobacterium sp. xlx-214]